MARKMPVKKRAKKKSDRNRGLEHRGRILKAKKGKERAKRLKPKVDRDSSGKFVKGEK